MLDKSKIYLKVVKKYWIFLFVLIIIIISFNNLIVAIWIIIFAILIYLASWIPSIIFNQKIKKLMKENYTLEDNTIAKLMHKPLSSIQEFMFTMTQKQEKKEWVIIFINKHYIFYNQAIVQKYKNLYEKGLGEKEILESFKSKFVKTRPEVKAIEDVLIKTNRLNERKVSVKEYRDKKRFS